jgi:hypothetical protein
MADYVALNLWMVDSLRIIAERHFDEKETSERVVIRRSMSGVTATVYIENRPMVRYDLLRREHPDFSTDWDVAGPDDEPWTTVPRRSSYRGASASSVGYGTAGTARAEDVWATWATALGPDS